MAMFSNIFRHRPSASPDSVTFDASRYNFQGDREGARVWFLPEGGGVGLYFFPVQPDLPLRAASVGQLRESYTARMDGKAQVVDCRVMKLDGVPGIWLVIKQKQEPRGMTYLGSLTIPFREFSFVIKIQCAEQGATGMREALLIGEALKKGTGRVEGDRFVPDGWSFDDEQFDERLPQHPLSRVRRELRHIASSVRIEPKIKNEPPFELPQNDT